MKPTEVLKQEHQVILKVLDAAEREAARIGDSHPARMDRIEKMVDFFREFADHCHHAKEEKLLFVKLQERGMVVDGSPIGVMLHEHDQGRRLVGGVAEAVSFAARGDEKALATIAKNLADYAVLLRMHIDKEDNILYVMADDLLSDTDQEELSRAFERVEAEEMEPGTHEKYHQLAHELAED